MELATYCPSRRTGHLLAFEWNWQPTALRVELATYCPSSGQPWNNFVPEVAPTENYDLYQNRSLQFRNT
jgi:hypothetical protein